MRPPPPIDPKIKSDLFAKFKWKYLRIDAQILELVLDGKLNLTEAILFSIIDAAVDVRGEGCYIANKTLAIVLRIKNRNNITTMKRKLRKLGLIEEVGTKKVGDQEMPVLQTCYTKAGGAYFNTGPLPTLKSLNCISLHSIQDSNTPEVASATFGEISNLDNTPVGFIERMGIKLQNKYTKFDEECARQFRKAVITYAGVQTYSHSPKKWADEFRILRKHRTPGEISTLLDWVETRAQWFRDNKKSFPRNARTFRQWFDGLFDQMEKDQRTEVEVTQDALDILRQVSALRWPKDSAEKLPQAIQITLNNWKEFYRKLKEYTQKNPEWIKNGKTLQKTASHVWTAHHLSRNIKPEFKTLEWFRRVFESKHNWDAWDGNIIQEAFDGNIKSDKFRKVILPIIGMYDRQSDVLKNWNQLAEELT